MTVYTHEEFMKMIKEKNKPKDKPKKKNGNKRDSKD